MARLEAGNISVITPPALVRGEEPKKPAKKRQMRSVSMFCAVAQPMWKSCRSKRQLVEPA